MMFVQQVQGFGAGGVIGYRDRVRHHEIVHARRHITEIGWQRIVKAGEHRIDARVGIATPRGGIANFAPHLFESGVGDRGANRVGVRVFVTNDESGRSVDHKNVGQTTRRDA